MKCPKSQDVQWQLTAFIITSEVVWPHRRPIGGVKISCITLKTKPNKMKFRIKVVSKHYYSNLWQIRPNSNEQILAMISKHARKKSQEK